MKRKMLAVRKLFEAGATRVIIADGRAEHPTAAPSTPWPMPSQERER